MSVTMKKVRRLVKSRGVGGLFTRGTAQFVNWLGAWRGVRGAGPMAPGQALEFTQRFGGFIKPSQVPSEVLSLMDLLREIQPRNILEIGTANGGTLFLLTRVAAPDATLISLDLPGGEFGDGYPVWKIPLYRSFALPAQTVKLIRGDSHQPGSVELVRDAVNRQPLDFLFIDGDHTYDGVKKDFEMYAPLVRKGGWVGFHDIVEHPPQLDCNVFRYWSEIKQRYPHREFIDDPQQGWAGIGVVQMPG